jgi:type IV pilus assembly protein PilE
MIRAMGSRRGNDALCAARAGFVLVEVMKVLLIVVILAAIAIPSYLHAIRKASRAEGRAALLQLMQQQERFYTQNTRYLAFSSASVDESERRFKWYSGDRPDKSAYEIEGVNCEAEAIRDCVLLVARPGTEKVNRNYKDPDCGELSLASDGRRRATGSARDCW